MSLALNSHGSRASLAAASLRVLYLLGGLFVLGVIAVWANTLLTYGPIHNDECLWIPQARGADTVLLVAQVMPGGAAAEAGMLRGDRIHSINGRPIPKGDAELVSWQAQRLLNEAPAGVPIPYVVERNGDIIPLRVILTEVFPWTQYFYTGFAALWILIGLVVTLARPTGSVQGLFHITALTVFFSFSTPSPPVLSTPFWNALWLVFGTIFFLTWVYFCASFPVRQKILASSRRRQWLSIPVILISATLVIVTIMEIQGGALTVALTVMLVVLRFIYFSLGIALLFRGYARMPEGTDRRPMRMILAGTVIFATVLLYLLLLGLGLFDTNMLVRPEVLAPMALLLVLPLSFGYAIFRYELMDVRAVVRTTLVYAVATAAIAGLYMAVALRIGASVGGLLGEEVSQVVRAAIFIAFLLVFDPIRRWVQSAIERRFFPQYRDYSGHLDDYARRMTEAVSVDQVATLISDTLRRYLDLEAVCVLTATEGERLRRVEGTCDGEELNEETASRLGAMLRLSQEMILLNPKQEPDLTPIAATYPYAVGLYSRGRLIGAVLLGKRRDSKPISGSQISFVNSVASQGASGIEAARLYERELERRRYEEELATARRIQQSLLPSRMPPLPGASVWAISQPALAVGGDYYDILPLEGERFLVMIADVSGKGLPAALYMAELHGMARVVTSICRTPKEMLVELNQHLVGVLGRGVFITATFCLFDVRARTATIARAGHTSIIIRGENGVRRLAPRGLPLGVRSQELFEESLEEIAVEYDPGATFLLYSDGVTEAMNATREEFGEERLIDTLRSMTSVTPSELTERITNSIEIFRGETDQNDDITVVVACMSEAAVSTEYGVPSTKGEEGDTRNVHGFARADGS